MTEPVDTPTTAPETAPSRRPRRLAVAGAAGVVAAQVTDEAAARKGIDGLSDCGGQEIGLAFVDGYALLSDSQKSVETAIDANAKGTLGDDKDFVADMDALGEQGIASAWFDASAISDALAASALAPAGAAQLDQLKNAGSGALVIRVAGSAIELAAVTTSTEDADVDPAPIGDLPAATVVALSLSGLGPQVSAQFDELRDSLEEGLGAFTGPSIAAEPFDPELLSDLDPETRDSYEKLLTESQAPAPSVDDLLDSFETETGLSLPEDLATLLGKTFTLAVGRANLENLSTLEGPDDLAKFDLAIRSQGDPAKAKSVMDTLVGLAEDNGVPLVTEQTDDGAVLATNQKAAEALLSGGKLHDTDRFKNVMPYGDETLQGLYVDASAIIDAIRASDPLPSVLESLTQVEAISGAGFSVGQINDDRIGLSIRVAFVD